MAYIILFACASVFLIFVVKFVISENEAGDNLIRNWRERRYSRALIDTLLVILASGFITLFFGGIAMVVGGGIGEIILANSSRGEQANFAFAVKIVGGFLWMLTAIIMIAQAAKCDGVESWSKLSHLNQDVPPPKDDAPSIDATQLIFHPVDRIVNQARLLAARSFLQFFGETHEESYARLDASLAKMRICVSEPQSDDQDGNWKRVIQSFIDDLIAKQNTIIDKEKAAQMVNGLIKAEGYKVLSQTLFLDIFAHAFGIHGLTTSISGHLHKQWDELSRVNDNGLPFYQGVKLVELQNEFREAVNRFASCVNWRLNETYGLIVLE